MFVLQKKCLSIITQFGCHYACPYCVVTNNDINIPKTTLKSLSRLHECLNQHPEFTELSISGGGDPLFNYDQHRDWYEKLYEIMSHHPQIRLKLHTSYVNLPDGFDTTKWVTIAYHVNLRSKLVAHDPNESLVETTGIKYIKRFPGVNNRVVFVVEDEFTPSLIDEVTKYVKSQSNIDQLSFRQLIDDNFKPTFTSFDYLKSGHESRRWFYIHQDDYNIYLVENRLVDAYQKLVDEFRD